MKKIAFVFTLFVSTVLVACNESGKKQGNGNPGLKEQADSLEKKVDEEHIVAMRKFMKIPDLQKKVNHLLDSIAKLPAKARETAASYKGELEVLNKELGEASASMENWMEAFGERLQELNEESMKDSLEQRVKFLTEEKIKVDRVKEAVLGSTQKAAALLKEKL